MNIDATFWVSVSFFIFIGGLIYLKVPQKISAAINEKINEIKKEINEAEKLKDESKKLLDDFEVKISEASFPLEMFLLFGENYVKDPATGKTCHKKRVAFEQNLRKQDYQLLFRY